ncbi:translocation/assembly module TamB domain-containing protein [Algihabitans albus]|uniref:translocation/assembly module TamB domain-containing protein n=1 Tax=Algihabitans albus TaxID=2164067 RepID=UPI000E5D4BD4|nr:translocation/assembly module TamB domain-containing protein [Algihabitans albus]
MAEGDLRAGPRPSQPPGGRRRRRWLWWIPAALVGLPLLLLLLALAALQTGPGRGLVIDLAESAVPGLEIGRLEGAPPFETIVSEVTLTDADGVWLSLDRGRVAWDALGLFQGTLAVEALDLGTLEVVRAPLAGPPVEDAVAEPEGGLVLPQAPPVGLRLDRFAVDRLLLGASLLGERLELAVEGRAAAGDASRVESQLRVRRLDGEGAIMASAVYFPPSGRLEADLEATAPAGGLATRLLDLPGEPPLAVRLTGAGPLEGWRGDWSVEAGEAAQASGVLTVESLEPPSLRLTGQAQLAALLPPNLRVLLEPQLDFAMSASYGDSLGLVVERFETGAAALEGFADLNLDSEDLSGQIELILADPAGLADLIAPANLSGGRLSVIASGSLSEPDLLLSGELERLEASGFETRRLRVNGQVIGTQPATFTLEAEAAGLSGPPALAEALGDRLSLSARGQASDAWISLERLIATTPAASVTGDGTLDLTDFTADGALALTYNDLGRLAALTGLDLAGAWQGEAYLDLADSGSISAVLSGQAEALRIGLPALEALLGPSPMLWAEAELGADGALILESLHLDGAALTVAGQGRSDAQGRTLAADLTASFPDLARLQAAELPLAGQARIDLAATGSLARPDLTLEAAAPELVFDGRELRDLALTGRMVGLPPELTGRLDLEVGTPAGPVALGSDVAIDGERLRLDDLRLARGGDSLSGRLAMPLAGPPAEGSLALRVADLAAYAPLVPELAGGSLEGTLDLISRTGDQAAELAVQAQGLSLSDGLGIATAEVTASLDGLLATHSLRAAVRATDLRAGDATLTAVAIQAEGGLADLAISLEAEGATAGPEPRALALAAQARAVLEEPQQLDLARLEARYGDLETRLRQPASLTFGAGRLGVEGLRLGFDEGELDLDAQVENGWIEAGLAVRDLPLSLAAAAGADLPLEGLLHAEANLSGALPRPEGQLRLRTDGLRFAERVAEETLPLALEVDGRLTRGRFSTTARLSGFAEESLDAQAELPLLITDAPLGLVFPQDEPVSASVRWLGNLAPVVGLFPIDVVRIEGQGELDMTLRGSLGNPQASGALTVTDGIYENFTLGTLLRPFDLSVEGEGSRLVLRGFNARDGDGGSLRAAGWLDLAGDVPRFEVEAETNAAILVRRDDLSAEINSQISLSGDLEAASLTGDIEPQRIEVSLAGELPPSVATLDVEEINTGRPEPAETEAQAGPDPGLAFLGLDVGISIPGRLFVRGRGLDSEWRGTFRLKGTAAAPQLRGDLRPVRGFFDLAGRRFELERGSITFAGGTDLDPQLDLTTVYRADGFTGRIAVTGPASAPVLSLSSEPELPNDEILSRILFGEGTARLSAAQAVQVAQAAATLTGGGGGGLLDVARQTLGVDVLTLAPGAGEDDLGQIEAGRYLADDVFVGVRQGATPGSSSAVVEWEVTPNLTLESEVGGATRESNVGFSWEWDY